jgi:hypothetical protein
MRFTKILLVCLGLVLFAGSRGNQGWAAAGSANHQLKAAVLPDGGDPLPIPPLVADGGDPLPIPPLVADGGDPLPIPPLVADGGDPLPIPPLFADGGDPLPIPPLANGFAA